MALIESRHRGENIDLFPMAWLPERGCQVTWGSGANIITPKGQTFKMAFWGDLPYLKKDQLEQILEDLPDGSIAGRSGKPCSSITASCIVLGPRACGGRVLQERDEEEDDSARRVRKEERAQIRRQLAHVREEMTKKEFDKLVGKYSSIPDEYYRGEHDVVDDLLKSNGRKAMNCTPAVPPTCGS